MLTDDYRKQVRADLKKQLTKTIVEHLPKLREGQVRTIMTNPQEFQRWVNALGEDGLRMWVERGQNGTVL